MTGLYNQALRDLAVEVIELPEQADLADSVFVEDAALVFDGVAIITHPGAISRRPETSSISAALVPHRPLTYIKAPAILDGGDVLTSEKEVYVGLSSRSNREAVMQLQLYLQHCGYTVHGLEMGQCLHLKNAVTALDNHTVLLNLDWVDADLFKSYTVVKTHPNEPFDASVVRAGSSLVYGACYPATQATSEALSHNERVVDMSELAKAEGAVTCCSLLFN